MVARPSGCTTQGPERAYLLEREFTWESRLRVLIFTGGQQVGTPDLERGDPALTPAVREQPTEPQLLQVAQRSLQLWSL